MKKLFFLALAIAITTSSHAQTTEDSLLTQLKDLTARVQKLEKNQKNVAGKFVTVNSDIGTLTGKVSRMKDSISNLQDSTGTKFQLTNKALNEKATISRVYIIAGIIVVFISIVWLVISRSMKNSKERLRSLSFDLNKKVDKPEEPENNFS